MTLATVITNEAPSLQPDAWKRSSVRHNLLANLGGKGLSLLISLACVPVYIRVLGIAGYGLIGIWMTLETVANLIDLGLSPTITREMAACSTRADGAQEARDLVRTLEVGYWAIGVAIGGVVISCASPIASHWLRSSQLSPQTLRSAIVLIGVLILCRWPVTFYCGGLAGLERQVLLSGVGTTYAYLRSLGSVFILLFVSPTIFAFFVFQIAINLVQTVVLTILLWRCLPPGQTPRFRPELVRRIWRFAGGISASTLVWLLVSELDKFVVSAMLPLESFGYYMLGSRIAACLGVASSPLFIAFFPALLPAGGFWQRAQTGRSLPSRLPAHIRAGSARRADRDFLRQTPDLRLDRQGVGRRSHCAHRRAAHRRLGFDLHGRAFPTLCNSLTAGRASASGQACFRSA